MAIVGPSKQKLPVYGHDIGSSLVNKALFGDDPMQDTAGARPDWANPQDIQRGSQGYLAAPYELQKQGDVGFTGSLAELNDKLSGINLNKDALESLRARGLAAPGTSDWEKLQYQKQGADELTQREGASRSNAGATSDAFSQIASKGGLSSGARERLAAGGAKNYAQSLQDVARAGAGQRTDIGIAGENQRLDILKALPGMEVQALSPEFQKTGMWADLANNENTRKQALDLGNRDYSTNVDKYNVDNRLAEVKRQDDAKMAKYTEDMRAYAAAKSSDALANAPQKGGKGGK